MPGVSSSSSSDGSDIEAEIERGGRGLIYSLDATVGTTYDIEVVLGTLQDSVLEIWASDRATFVVMNDDANGGLGSAISFSPPSSGTYYLVVRGYSQSQRGTFSLSVDDGAGGAGGRGGRGGGGRGGRGGGPTTSGDPCTPPGLAFESGATIDFTEVRRLQEAAACPPAVLFALA